MRFKPGTLLRCEGTPELVKIITRDFDSAPFGLVLQSGVSGQWMVHILWLGPVPWVEEVNPDWLSVRYRICHE